MYGFFGWLVGWLIGCCLVVWLAGWLNGWLGVCWAVKSTKLGIENRSSWLPKPLLRRPKSSKIGAKRLLGRVLGVSGGFLEGSWGALGPKTAPRSKIDPKS